MSSDQNILVKLNQAGLLIDDKWLVKGGKSTLQVEKGKIVTLIGPNGSGKSTTAVILSGGEFQRVLIARAISKKPELLVLDEPVQGVDYTGEIALYELIKRISDTLNCGILLISHDLHTVMTATDHVVCLNGHVCCSGSPMDVAKNNEYKTLFGEQASQILSVYEHKHDHVHSDKGEIKKN